MTATAACEGRRRTRPTSTAWPRAPAATTSRSAPSRTTRRRRCSSTQRADCLKDSHARAWGGSSPSAAPAAWKSPPAGAWSTRRTSTTSWKPEALAAANALEVFREADGDTPVAWSFISPGALLAPGERTGRYRLGGDQLLVAEDGRSHISMEDFAIAILDEAENPKHPRQRFTAAY